MWNSDYDVLFSGTWNEAGFGQEMPAPLDEALKHMLMDTRLHHSCAAKAKKASEPDSERVQVTVRVRPPTKAEETKEDGVPFIFLDTEKNAVIVRRKGSFVDFTEFKFDAVLPPSATQADVYNVSAQAVVQDVLDGYNGTIMAYGQTGAGKTYTLSDMVSDNLGGTSIEGIIPRSAADIYIRAETDKDHEYRISMSYIQIYMEMIQDLLRPENSNLSIRETETGEIFVAGIEEVQVKSIEDVMKLLMIGDRNRRFAFTRLNAHSSRSHTIAMITVEKKAISSEAKGCADKRKRCANSGVTEKVLVGKLFLVDLAGSERLKKSGSEGLRASEAMSVNMSLTALGKCISARADPSVMHVPFRDSKLTRLLQESLGGNAKTSLIVNIAPCSEYLQETLSSLQFGARAMKVPTRAIINVEEEFRAITRNLQEALELQDERLHSLEAAVHHKDAQLEAAKLSLELKTREMERLREEQKQRDEQAHRSEKFLEQLKVKDKEWQNRLTLIKIAAKDHLIEKEQDRMEAAARRIQKAYKKHYVCHILEEKRKVELLAGSQLLANSASKVLKSIASLDEYFTGKR